MLLPVPSSSAYHYAAGLWKTAFNQLVQARNPAFHALQNRHSKKPFLKKPFFLIKHFFYFFNYFLINNKFLLNFYSAIFL